MMATPTRTSTVQCSESATSSFRAFLLLLAGRSGSPTFERNNNLIHRGRISFVTPKALENSQKLEKVLPEGRGEERGCRVCQNDGRDVSLLVK